MRELGDSAFAGDDALEILQGVFEFEQEIFKKVIGDQKVHRKGVASAMSAKSILTCARGLDNLQGGCNVLCCRS
jgi:hypothetical protein